MVRSGRKRVRGRSGRRISDECAKGYCPDDFPDGSPEAHPGLLRKHIVAIGDRFGPDVQRRYVGEIWLSLRKFAGERGWLSDRTMSILMFPEDALDMRHARRYEIGARCPEVLHILGVGDPCQACVYEFVFYSGQGRWYDAIEAASRAFIEREKRNGSGSDIVEAVRNIEMATLMRVLLAGEKRKT